MTLLCAWCLAKDTTDTWKTAQAVVVYKGQSLCYEHFRETRALEPIRT